MMELQFPGVWILIDAVEVSGIAASAPRPYLITLCNGQCLIGYTAIHCSKHTLTRRCLHRIHPLRDLG